MMIAINSFITELFFDVPQHRDNWVLIENFNNHLLNIINISVNHSNGSTDADSLLESNWSMHLVTFINIFPENFHLKLNITWSTLFICWFGGSCFEGRFRRWSWFRKKSFKSRLKYFLFYYLCSKVVYWWCGMP